MKNFKNKFSYGKKMNRRKEIGSVDSNRNLVINQLQKKQLHAYPIESYITFRFRQSAQNQHELSITGVCGEKFGKVKYYEKLHLQRMWDMAVKKADVVLIRGFFNENSFSSVELLDEVLKGLHVGRLILLDLNISEVMFFLLISKFFLLVRTVQSYELPSNLNHGLWKQIFQVIAPNNKLEKMKTACKDFYSLDWGVLRFFRDFSGISNLQLGSCISLSQLLRLSRRVQFSLTEMSIVFRDTREGILFYYLSQSSLLSTLTKVNLEFNSLLFDKRDVVLFVELMNRLRTPMLFKVNVGAINFNILGMLFPFIFSKDTFMLQDSTFLVGILRKKHEDILSKKKYISNIFSTKWKISVRGSQQYFKLYCNRNLYDKAT
eukprot:snap_masked-scaffold_19-processed-gene-1.45-mRNA-1 protein AED:1.00 eAED:1.00 QI:0/-1/0/0/-1/1/1/0/375